MNSSTPFTPGGNTSLSVTTSSARVALPQGVGGTIRMGADSGGSTLFLKFGDSTVTAAVSDTWFYPGAIETFTIPADSTHVAAITATGTATLRLTRGEGV